MPLTSLWQKGKNNGYWQMTITNHEKTHHKQFDPTTSWETFQNWSFLSTDYAWNMEIFGHPPRHVTVLDAYRVVADRETDRTKPSRSQRGRHLAWTLKNYIGSLFN